MRALFLLHLILLAAVTGSAAEKPSLASPHPSLEIKIDGETGRFSPAQRAFVQSWIRQSAPESPVDLSGAVAEAFLAELAANRPDQLDRLLNPDFATSPLDSQLLRQVGITLGNPALAAAREKIAERRVAALLAQDGQPVAGAAALVAKIREGSPAQYRRLVEGRADDDDLASQIRKTGKPSQVAPAQAAPVMPKEISAAEIVSEYSRRNQTGSAVLRLQAFVAEGDLTSATGEVSRLVVGKMRPNRARLVVLKGGLTTYTLGADEDRFWRQLPGQAPQYRAGKDMGEQRYLAEFADPFFSGDGYLFERLADGAAEGRAFYRINVQRKDGSGYIARIDPGSFRQIGRENPDKSVVNYSDFRDIAGVIFAFREEVVDAAGRKGTLQLSRLTPNPGLLEEFFFPPLEPGLDYFQVEQVLHDTPGATLSLK